MPTEGFQSVTVRNKIVKMIDKVIEKKKGDVQPIKSRAQVVEIAVNLLAREEKIDISDIEGAG